jgi:hypothetical protein
LFSAAGTSGKTEHKAVEPQAGIATSYARQDCCRAKEKSPLFVEPSLLGCFGFGFALPLILSALSEPSTGTETA